MATEHINQPIESMKTVTKFPKNLYLIKISGSLDMSSFFRYCNVCFTNYGITQCDARKLFLKI